MIIKITFLDATSKPLVMLFGDSYKTWKEQVREYLEYTKVLGVKNVESSQSKWIAWGGLKWCAEEDFQAELNREGCQQDEPDNPEARQYADMKFSNNAKATKEVIKMYKDRVKNLKVKNEP